MIAPISGRGGADFGRIGANQVHTQSPEPKRTAAPLCFSPIADSGRTRALQTCLLVAKHGHPDRFAIARQHRISAPRWCGPLLPKAVPCSHPRRHSARRPKQMSQHASTVSCREMIYSKHSHLDRTARERIPNVGATREDGDFKSRPASPASSSCYPLWLCGFPAQPPDSPTSQPCLERGLVLRARDGLSQPPAFLRMLAILGDGFQIP